MQYNIIGNLRFINDPHNVKASNGSSIFSSLTLSIIEVSWHSDDSMSDLLAQVGLCSFLHLCEHHSTDFFSRKKFLLTTNIYFYMRLLVLLFKLLTKK